MNYNLKKVVGFGFIETEDSFYTGDMHNNAICRCCKKDGSTFVLNYLSDLPYCKDNCFSKVASIDNMILFVPQYGNFFYIYDVEKCLMHDIPVETEMSVETEGISYWDITVSGRFFYVFGFKRSNIIRINVDTFKTDYLTDFVGEFHNHNEWNEDENRYFFADGAVLNSGKLYIPTGLDHTLFSLSEDNGQYAYVKVRTNIQKILSVSGYQEEIWMTDFDGTTGRIAIFTPLNNSIEEIILPSKGTWYAPFFHEKYAYLMPMSNVAACFRVNIVTRQVEIFHRLDELFRDDEEVGVEERRRNANVLSFRQNGCRVTFIRRPDYTWFTYDFETDELTTAVYEITDEEYLSKLETDYYSGMFQRAKEDNVPLSETDMPLKEYVDRIF